MSEMEKRILELNYVHTKEERKKYWMKEKTFQKCIKKAIQYKRDSVVLVQTDNCILGNKGLEKNLWD